LASCASATPLANAAASTTTSHCCFIETSSI
jgi:hypothetical protein